ncbi:hypothetical protein Leryth_005502 [Lithospermum erythrorhizon]|nr:hypothetical protein Leryth_005502 [Lithospermum erythrorhizon]
MASSSSSSPPNPKFKRPCCSSSPPNQTTPTLNPPNPPPTSFSIPNSTPTTFTIPISTPITFNNPNSALKTLNNPIDFVLEAFLGLSDASSVAIDLAFDRILEATGAECDRNALIEKALVFGSRVVEAGKRAARKRDSAHNCVVWPLNSDLTVKVFSSLDTQSVCYAAATCSFFNKCAADPACYADIDLTGEISKVNNVVVSTMIQRAGRSLRSLKLGIVHDTTSTSSESSDTLVCSVRKCKDASGFSWNETKSRQGRESFVLTRSCLVPLSADGGSIGALLRRLHLYHIERMDNPALCTALRSCPSLIDLGIIGLHVELSKALESVSKCCPLLEHLYFESSKTGRDDILRPPTCTDLVKNCPRVCSLALRGFKLHDLAARALVKGFRNLKFLDFSTSYSVTGSFLKNIGGSLGGNLLEVLILRDCVHLKEMEVARFLSAVISGEFKYLRYLDISNREGLASEGDWYRRICDTSFIPVAQLFEERPNLFLLAEFPSCPTEMEQITGSDIDSFISSPSPPFFAYNGSVSMASTESSYNSDRGSGNEDSQDSVSANYDDASDELDFSL